MTEHVGLAAFYPQKHVVQDIEYDLDDPSLLRFVFGCLTSVIIKADKDYTVDELEPMIGSWCIVNLDAETGEMTVRSKPYHE